MSYRVKLAFALAFLVGVPVLAVSTEFSSFTPLISSAPGVPIDGPEEATPITGRVSEFDSASPTRTRYNRPAQP
jgi:hypothetical protein